MGSKEKSTVAVGDVEFAPAASESDASASASEEADESSGSEAANDLTDAAVPVIEDDTEAEVGGRSGSILKRGSVEADVDGDQKNRKAKPIKMRRPAKAPKVKKAANEEELSLPVNVAVDFFRGVTKPREAEQIARAFIEKHFDAPNASWVYVQAWRDGIAVEMQEGGGRAYLPEVLAKLDEDPSAICVLPMANRVMQVRLDDETSSMEAWLLTAGQAPVDGAFIALPTASMTPFDRRGSKVFIAGVGLLAASFMALTFSVGAFFIDTKAWSAPYLQQTRVNDLPSVQSANLKAVLERADCVAKMEFQNGNWNIVPGWNDGNGSCTSTQPAAALLPSEPGPSVIDGANGQPPAPGIGGPTASGTPLPAPLPTPVPVSPPIPTP